MSKSQNSPDKTCPSIGHLDNGQAVQFTLSIGKAHLMDSGANDYTMTACETLPDHRPLPGSPGVFAGQQWSTRVLTKHAAFGGIAFYHAYDFPKTISSYNRMYYRPAGCVEGGEVRAARPLRLRTPACAFCWCG